jgi:tripartite-type tricarboxylate transporter receptor subunit TctC
VAEAGLADYRYESWFGVLAPAGTPPAILAKVSQDIGKVLQAKDVTDKLTTQGSIPAPNTPDEFAKIIKEDVERYGVVMKKAGVGTN